MILALLLGCNPLPDVIAMTGTVWDEPYEGGHAVAGAAIAVLDDGYAAFDDQAADADGAFTVDLPAGVPFFLTVSAEGFVPTAFSGTAGIYDFEAPAGYPWVASEAWMDELRADFSACPTVGAEGTVGAGEVRGFVSDVAYDDLPLVLTATARAFASDGNEYAACYLDDEGASSADATETGDTGRFAIFGVPAGEVVVDVRYTDPGGTVPVELFRFVAPEQGLVPLYPALVDLGY